MPQPVTASNFLGVDELPMYAPNVVVPAALAQNMIQRASALVCMRYDRTPEIATYTRELVELTESNEGHLINTPVQVTADGFLDATLGDVVQARYTGEYYPFAYFGPPPWQDLDVTTVDLQPNLGRLLLPVGFWPVPWTECRVTYRAGFCPVGGPYPEWLKQGVGKLIENVIQKMGGTVASKLQLADGQVVQFWDGSLFDETVESFLAPLRPNAFF